MNGCAAGETCPARSANSSLVFVIPPRSTLQAHGNSAGDQLRFVLGREPKRRGKVAAFVTRHLGGRV